MVDFENKTVKQQGDIYNCFRKLGLSIIAGAVADKKSRSPFIRKQNTKDMKSKYFKELCDLLDVEKTL